MEEDYLEGLTKMMLRCMNRYSSLIRFAIGHSEKWLKNRLFLTMTHIGHRHSSF